MTPEHLAAAAHEPQAGDSEGSGKYHYRLLGIPSAHLLRGMRPADRPPLACIRSVAPRGVGAGFGMFELGAQGPPGLCTAEWHVAGRRRSPRGIAVLTASWSPPPAMPAQICA
jgi:hypothetical protein